MIRKRSLEHKLKQYAGVSLGCLIASCSINLFLVSFHLLTVFLLHTYLLIFLPIQEKELF